MVVYPSRSGPAVTSPAGARPGRWRPDMPRSLQVQGLDTGVPPVGVEPTLGTLLGGRPLPLGYGGWAMIPRSAPIIRDRAMGVKKDPLRCKYPIPPSSLNA